MRVKNKLILALLLAAGTLAAFSACKKDEAKPQPPVDKDKTQVVQPTDPSDDETAIDYEADLSTERFDGYNFRMLVRKGSMKEQYMEEDSDDLVESKVYQRNKLVEDRFGITITATESSGNYETDALNSILAGDDAYDVIFAHSRAAFNYAVQGSVYNVHDIESIHLDKPWWFKDIVDTCTVNGRLYVLDGDMNVGSLSSAMCLVFNKRIFDELGFDYPYDLVKDGAWTFDELAYYAKKGGKDLDGDGIMNPEVDQFGFHTGEWSGAINILYAGGQKIYDKNDSGELELTLYSNKTVSIFDEFFNLMSNENCVLTMSEGANVYKGPAFFENGRAMIASAGLGSAKSFRNMEDDFGILPYPKFDEDDEYTTAINGAAVLAVVPITVPDVERTGAIIEALAAYGSREVIPAFYDVSLKTKYARDEESEEMMDIIRDSIIYDIGYVCGGPYESVGRDIAKLTNRDFSSFYAARESQARESLKKFNRDYAGIED